jgi:hypothetical protein
MEEFGSVVGGELMIRGPFLSTAYPGLCNRWLNDDDDDLVLWWTKREFLLAFCLWKWAKLWTFATPST